MCGAQLVQLDAGGEGARGRPRPGCRPSTVRASPPSAATAGPPARSTSASRSAVRAADEHGAGTVGARAQLGDGALADQPAGADDDHPVGGLLHLGEQVAGHQHGAALLVGQVPQEAAQPLDALGVQAVGRLVEHQDGGVAEQRGRPARAAAACPGSSRRPAGRPASVEPDLGEHLVGPRDRQPGRPAVDPQVVAAGAGRVEGGLQHGADGAQRARAAAA